MNLDGVKKRMALIEARLPMLGAGKQYPIAKGGGMRALLEAIQAAKKDRQGAPAPEAEGMPFSPFRALREDILRERARRDEWMAALPPNSLGNEPVIEETEEPGQCTVPTTAPPNPSS
jgi:hypothetical protein